MSLCCLETDFSGTLMNNLAAFALYEEVVEE